jgi:hypothetical protein
MKVLKAFEGSSSSGSIIDVMDVHEDGYTPFHRACWGREPRHTELVKVMVEEFGIDPLTPSKPSTKGSAEPGGKTCAEMTQNAATKAFITEALAAATAAGSSQEL